MNERFCVECKWAKKPWYDILADLRCHHPKAQIEPGFTHNDLVTGRVSTYQPSQPKCYAERNYHCHGNNWEPHNGINLGIKIPAIMMLFGATALFLYVLYLAFR